MRFTAAAMLLAASVLLSRLLGFVREMVLAYQLGATPELGAYYAAFQIPDILNYFLAGGALSIAFVPFYTRARSDAGEEGAARLLATILGTMTALAVIATALLWWQADALVRLQFPRFEPEIHALTVRLTRIVLPAQIFFVAGGILRAALMARGFFGAQAAAPSAPRSAPRASRGAPSRAPPSVRSWWRCGTCGAGPIWRSAFASRRRIAIFSSTSSSPRHSCSGSRCSPWTSGTTAGSAG